MSVAAYKYLIKRIFKLLIKKIDFFNKKCELKLS